jgi:hypothetical protein
MFVKNITGAFINSERLSPDGPRERTIRAQIIVRPFSFLFKIFTNLSTKEFGIDIRRGQQDYNPPQSRRPC